VLGALKTKWWRGLDEASVRVATLADALVRAAEARATDTIDVLLPISLCKMQPEES
jgi:hypothetical protein